jgi:hypothetical protein
MYVKASCVRGEAALSAAVICRLMIGGKAWGSGALEDEGQKLRSAKVARESFVAGDYEDRILRTSTKCVRK